MLADSRRVRLLVLGGLILAAAVLLRLATGQPPAERAAPDSGAVATAVPGSVAAADPARERRAEPDDIEIAEAHAIAEDFAQSYLTWLTDEPHGDRIDRISEHTTADLAETLAGSYDLAVTDRDEDAGGGEQAAEVLAIQTLTARRHHIEVAVMAEVTGENAVVPTSLTVLLIEEGGRWLVDDLR